MEFTTLVSLKDYQNKINNFQQGEIIYLTEEKKAEEICHMENAFNMNTAYRR